MCNDCYLTGSDLSIWSIKYSCPVRMEVPSWTITFLLEVNGFNNIKQKLAQMKVISYRFHTVHSVLSSIIYSWNCILNCCILIFPLCRLLISLQVPAYRPFSKLPLQLHKNPFKCDLIAVLLTQVKQGSKQYKETAQVPPPIHPQQLQLITCRKGRVELM